MPNYRGHLVGGAVTFGIVVLVAQKEYAGLLTLTEWLIFTLLGSLFPDIDTKSKGRKIYNYVLLIALLYALLQQDLAGAVFIAILGIIPYFVRHRGIFHSIWFIVLCTLGPIIYGQLYLNSHASRITWDALFFGAGAFSHILLDFGLFRLIKRSF